MADEKVAEVVVPVAVVVEDAVIEKDELTLTQEKLAKVEEERDNYKAVALKRLGKLPGDAEFLNTTEGAAELTVAEQVRMALLDREVESVKQAEKEATAKVLRENVELKLALKNRPGAGLGGSSNTGTEVKDNVFSEDQLVDLRARAARLKADPEKFIENAKKNLLKGR